MLRISLLDLNEVRSSHRNGMRLYNIASNRAKIKNDLRTVILLKPHQYIITTTPLSPPSEGGDKGEVKQ
jgi:hypothetical protein